MRKSLLLFFLLILTACSTTVPELAADVDQEILFVYTDAFSEQWLPKVYTCAERSAEWLVFRTPDIDAANIVLRVNATPQLGGTPYQVGELEFVVATNAQNLVADISLESVQQIYTGGLRNWAELEGRDAPIEVWAYSSEIGLNEILLGGGSLSSLAKQAQGPGAMRAALEGNIAAIGFLPRKEALSADNIQIIGMDEKFIFPVLVFLSEESPYLKNLVQCLQSNIE